MKSQQINFFLSPTEFGQLENLVHNLGFVILSYEVPTPDPCVIPDFSHPLGVKFFALPDQLSFISFIEGKNTFVLDETNSPIISFGQNRMENQKLNRGWFYYLKDNRNNEPKNPEFLKKAQLLFKQFKKTFPDPKLEGYQNFWVSPQAAELHKQGVVLVK
jgi:hypothetical protein